MTIVARSCAAFLIVLLVACGGPVPEPLPGGAVSGTLGPAGGVIIGPDGMAFGVPVGNLDQDVVVTLERAPMPVMALPAAMVAEGRAYRISGSVDVFASSTERGFLIGLPIPDGVDGSRVALAFRVPGEDALDGDEGDAWYVALGHHDAEQGWFVTSTAALLVEGGVVVLVSGPELVAEPATPPHVEGVSTALHIVCTGWLEAFKVVTVGDNLTLFAQFELEQHLNDALAIYRSLGFEPFLLRQAGWRHYMTPALAAIFADDCSEIKYEARLEEQESGTILGWYSVSQQALTVYETSDMRDTTFHELFHSIQARYLGPAVMADDNLTYFTEATAVLSEALSHIPPLLDVTRADRPVRTVDETLLAPYTKSNARAGALPYNAQDFWAFAANRFGRPFHTFTLDFLTAGGVAARDVDAVFRKAPYASSFAEMYHEWVLDQIFDLSTCSFIEDAVKERVEMGVVVVKDDGTSGLPNARIVTRDPLTARVSRVKADDSTVDEPFQLAVRVEGDWAKLDVSSVAVIQKSDTSCSVHRDTSFELIGGDTAYAVHRLSMAPYATDEFYVVLLNGAHEENRSGRLLLDPAPHLIDVSVSPSAIVAEAAVKVTYSLRYDDLGANLDRLNVIVELGGQLFTNIGLDVADSDITSGFGAAVGTGSYHPTVFVYCSEKGKNPLSMTLQLVDEIGFVSQEKSVDVMVDYDACP